MFVVSARAALIVFGVDVSTGRNEELADVEAFGSRRAVKCSPKPEKKTHGLQRQNETGM